MKINMSRKQLLMLDTEAEQMRGHIEAILLHSKLQQFYKDNGAHIISSKEKQQKIFIEFLVIEENGQLKTEIVDNQPKVVLKEKIREREFEEKMSTLMDEVVAIEI